MSVDNKNESRDTTHSSAHHFLVGLTDLELDYIFANLGTDHAPLIETLAQWQKDNRPHPKIILCPHENVAIHMAAGVAAVTGKGQAVLVHVDAGTANAAMGVHNLFRTRLPVLLMSGKTPFTLRNELPGSRDNYVHFVQDPFDIGSLVRPYVKWEYSLPSGITAKEVLRRAHSVMQSDPPGPVYLTLPREVLAETIEDRAVQPFNAQRYGPVALGGIDDMRARAIAEQLMRAKHPMVVTSYLGRKAQAVKALETLAELCGIRVYEFSPSYLNVSRASPCFGGFDPAHGLQKADLGLLLDVDVPWLPKFTQENPDTHWIHIDVDPIKKDFPMWGFATDMRVQADCANVLEQIIQHVRDMQTPAYVSDVASRIGSWEVDKKNRADRLTQLESDPGKQGAISSAYLLSKLGAALAPQDIVINEAIRNAPQLLNHLHRTEPLTLLGSAGGGLGYSGGIALGVKLARPEARVVQVVGDGGFHFSTPTSVYATSQSYGLPIFTVVLDNGGWQAVKESVLRMHPKGVALQQDEFQSRLQGKHRHFEQVAQAFGAYGECVSDPADVPAAIARCLHALDEGRSALLNVQIGLQ